MAAIKAYFYRLRQDMPDVCEGVDIPRYIDDLCACFNARSLEEIDPAVKLPGGTVYYSDSPRNCHESTAKYEIEDAVSDCLRLFDKKGRAKKAVAQMIAGKIVRNKSLRRELMAYNRVPQSWSEVLDPIDPEEKLNRAKIADMLLHLQDRDYSHRHHARGKRHPLARIMENKAFSQREKLCVVIDYIVGRRRKAEAPWALRIGSRGNYREYNLALWLEQNGAFVLNTVGDVMRLREHFTPTNKLKRASMPDLPQLEPGGLKPK